MHPIISSALSWRIFPLKTVIAAFALLFILWHIRTVSSGTFSTSFVPEIPTHPIHKRMAEAKSAYNKLLHRQSKDLEQATREYIRRYQTAPPEGFDQWHAYATKHNSLIFDDFDLINDNLRPFRAYLKGGCGLQLQDERFLKDTRLLQICIKNGELSFYGDKGEYIMKGFKDLVSDFLDKLPDLCFPMNMADEPMSSISPDTAQQNPNEELFCPALSFISYKEQNWWSEAVMNCPPQSPARMYPGKPDPSRAEGRLLDDFKSSSDLCAYSIPVEHGILISPSTLRMCSNVVPILSNAGFSTSSDILFPSIYRFIEWDQRNAEEDMPWGKKDNKAYWRGSTTGGHAHSHGWDRFQRHRLVDYTNNKLNNLDHVTDVGFSQVIQCDPEACKEMKEHYTIEGRPFKDVWKNKIAFDLDGNGLSGRFYPLLRSNSAVFRQSIFREWHDSRIFPWLHYVPLSMELTDLQELLGFYLGEGRGLLEQIARDGQDMADAVLRREDMKIYFYRLLIEMGRKN